MSVLQEAIDLMLKLCAGGGIVAIVLQAFRWVGDTENAENHKKRIQHIFIFVAFAFSALQFARIIWAYMGG